MIDVAMGQQNLLDPRANFADGLQDSVDVAARIDHGPALGRSIPKNCAVLLKGSDWDDRCLEALHRLFLRCLG